ncbi:hypothetical protein PoB_000346100 [Plakobranchus ocellatus]|uniref:Uncharacterized protein n=1 Tax=Plakobranchus ocellatus TaxID=259542 RepID=A0AAV3XJ72_9GAST|nr:hypothetical protein PoB_000346100 [Plakobranchus ocellatus]
MVDFVVTEFIVECYTRTSSVCLVREDGGCSEKDASNLFCRLVHNNVTQAFRPPSGQGAGGGARSHDRRVPADLGSLATVPPTPRRVDIHSTTDKPVWKHQPTPRKKNSKA